jgi:hypothetical protein
MNHQQVLHGFLLEDRAALCAALNAKTVDLAVFRRRSGKKMRTGPNPYLLGEAAGKGTARTTRDCRKSENELSLPHE